MTRTIALVATSSLERLCSSSALPSNSQSPSRSRCVAIKHAPLNDSIYVLCETTSSRPAVSSPWAAAAAAAARADGNYEMAEFFSFFSQESMQITVLIVRVCLVSPYLSIELNIRSA